MKQLIYPSSKRWLEFQETKRDNLLSSLPIYGYEPYFNHYVIVGYIRNNKLSFAHGYYPRHNYGLRMIKYAKRKGIKI